MIRYLLFDLDDTLYPASAGLMREISRRMNEFMVTQLGIPEGDVTRVRQDYWERYGTTLRGLYIERQIDAQAFLNFVHDIRTDEYLKADAVLDAMLQQLPQRKYVFTNSPADHARRVLTTLGILRHFDGIFDINFIGYESKPTPSGYARVLAALGARAEECLMIEDSARNLFPARSLGIRTVLLDGKGTGESKSEVDHVITRIYELADLLKELS